MQSQKKWYFEYITHSESMYKTNNNRSSQLTSSALLLDKFKAIVINNRALGLSLFHLNVLL